MKVFKCKYCGYEGNRKYVRKCIMKHIKTNKSTKPDRKIKSNITEALHDSLI